MTGHSRSRRGRTAAAAERTSPAALRTVARVVEVLELVADRPGGLAISEIASLLDMPVSSAHALVRRLAELDYLRRHPSERRYSAAPRLIRLGIRIAGGLEVMTVTRPFISDLAARTGEDVYLALADERGVTYADRAAGSQSLRLEIALGTPRPLHATAVGKLYLAMLGDDELDERLPRLELERYTATTLTGRADLRRELHEIRRAGYAVTHGEHIEGVASVAAPIRDGTGAFLGALALALPRRRFHEHRHVLINDVVKAANRISEQLGWQDAGSGHRGRRSLRIAGKAGGSRPAPRRPRRRTRRGRTQASNGAIRYRPSTATQQAE